MKKTSFWLITLLFAFLVTGFGAVAITGCGYSERANELTGQVKKVKDITPIICPDYTEVDISLGVMRNGVGSMSHEDVLLLVEGERDKAILKRAAESGEIVNVTYDKERITFCVPQQQVTSAVIAK